MYFVVERVSRRTELTSRGYLTVRENFTRALVNLAELRTSRSLALFRGYYAATCI